MVALLALWCALFWVSPSQAQSNWTLRGQVLDSTALQPIHGAWIEFAGGAGRYVTDVQGRFQIKLPAGRQVLVVRALGYSSARLEASVTSDTTFKILLAIEPVALEAIQVQIDRISERLKPLPWRVHVMTHDQLKVSGAATPVDALKGRHLTTYPCGNGAECIRYRNGLIEPLVCVDELAAISGLAELRTFSNASLQRIEVHDGGRIIRAYTTWFVDQLRAGRMNLKPALRIDRKEC